MNAPELRIGNLVSAENREALVKGISDIGCIVQYTDTFERSSHYIKCESIPLTESRLVRMGILVDHPYVNIKSFKLQCAEFRMIAGKVYFGFTVKENSFECAIELQYVHQLQNLYFALTGRELKMEGIIN